jgi:hypothetical protein
MQALSDEQQLERLERKVDEGFAEMRSEFKAVRAEARADFRLIIGILLPMYLTIILGFAALLLQHQI